VTDDGRWLVLHASRGTESRNRIYLRDLTGPSGPVRLVRPDDAHYELAGSIGDELFFLSDLDAPRGQVVAVDPEDGRLRTVIGEGADTLESVRVIGGHLVCTHLRDVRSRLVVYRPDGSELREIELPGIGTVSAVEGRADESALFLTFTSFTRPPQVYSADVIEAGLQLVFEAAAPEAELITEQVFVPSRDGTQVPVFLLHRADRTAANGPHPTWQYGYGGFNIAVRPEFAADRFTFAAEGGVVAVANLRGGGEYGSGWHDAGRREHKQNVFDDAIAVAAWLGSSGWSDAAHLAATGRSNGGLLAGALLTQRPELFACVVPEVGVLDMLRFPEWTIGWAWTSDYGDPRGSRAEFDALRAYSPLHRLRPGAGYPPVLILTSDHDDRVMPAHSFKFAARLQAVSPPDAIALLRVALAGGHGQGRSKQALIDERTDVIAFISTHTHLPWAEPPTPR
jgi:prolyl oligopeptidase